MEVLPNTRSAANSFCTPPSPPRQNYQTVTHEALALGVQICMWQDRGISEKGGRIVWTTTQQQYKAYATGRKPSGAAQLGWTVTPASQERPRLCKLPNPFLQNDVVRLVTQKDESSHLAIVQSVFFATGIAYTSNVSKKLTLPAPLPPPPPTQQGKKGMLYCIRYWGSTKAISGRGCFCHGLVGCSPVPSLSWGCRRLSGGTEYRTEQSKTRVRGRRLSSIEGKTELGMRKLHQTNNEYIPSIYIDIMEYRN